MATKYYNLKGTVNWCRTETPDTKYNEMGEFNMDFFPEDMDDYHRLGLERTPKKDADGNEYVKLKRDNKKLIKGELVEFGPPKVSIKDPKLGWVPFAGKIGNGSKVLINLSVFDTRKAPGHRVEGISILELVVYDPDSPTPSLDAEVEKLDDEIPF